MKILFLIFFCSSSAFALDCGEYEMYGSPARDTKGNVFYIVNTGTLSELKFTLTDTQEIKLAPYFNRSSKVRVVISKAMDAHLGEFADIKSAEYVVPDPAKITKKHGFVLIHAGKCQ